MTRTHFLFRYVAFEEIRHQTWADPSTGELKRPSSIGQLLGNPRWEQRLLKFLERTKIGRIGPNLIGNETRTLTRYEGWTDLVPDERSTDRGGQVADHLLDTIVTRQTWFCHWAQCLNLSPQRSSSLVFVFVFVFLFL
jgi:hypothetical protein